MIKGIQVTLYDVFGYLLPGSILLTGVVGLFWAILAPATPLVWPQVINENWIVIAVASYVCGHLAQALANMVTKHLPSIESLVLTKGGNDDLPEPVVAAARSKASSILAVDAKGVDSSLLYQICDETVAQLGITSDRDIYIYREGFYRGLTISPLFLCGALLVRATIPGTTLKLSDTLQSLRWPELVSLALLSLGSAWLSFNRYRRFGRYRVKQAILGFLLLHTKAIKEK